MFQMFQLFSVLCCSKRFHVASYNCFILNVSYVSHTCCKSMFLNILSVFQSYVAFMLQVFYVVRPGTSWWPADRARDAPERVPTDGVAAGRGALGACSSSAAHPGPRVSPAQRGRQSALVGGAKADEDGGRRQTGRAAQASGLPGASHALKKISISITFVVRIIYIELYKFPAPQNLKEKILH
jgi:hypothetical protein